MANLSQFVGFMPITSTPPQAAPQTVHKQPSSVQPPTIAQKIVSLADKDGMKPDDPLRLMLVGIAEAIDKLQPLGTSHGAEIGRLAAEAATTVMRQNANRLSSQIRGKTLAILGLTGVLMASGFSYAGYLARGGLPVQIDGVNYPREMAERLAYQNWHAQWDARQIVSSKEGYQWVMVPFVVMLPKMPNGRK